MTAVLSNSLRTMFMRTKSFIGTRVRSLGSRIALV